MSPRLVHYFAADQLGAHQLILSPDSVVRYNPFISNLHIYDLTITEQQGSNNAVFAVRDISLSISLYQLLFDKIVIDSFTVDGLTLVIDIANNQVNVAGFSIPRNSSNTDEDQGMSEDVSQSDKAFPFEIFLPELALKNSSIELMVDGVPHDMVINELVLSKLQVNDVAQSLTASFHSQINDSPFLMNVDSRLEKGKGKVLIDASIQNIQLSRFKQFLPAAITQFDGEFSYQAKHSISLSDDKLSIDLHDLEVLVNNLALSQQELHVHLLSQLIASDEVNIFLGQSHAVTISGRANVKLTGANIFTKTKEKQLVAFENLTVSDIDISVSEAENTIKVGSLALTNATLSDDLADNIPALATFSSLNINQIHASTSGVDANDFSVAGLVIDAELDQNKKLSNLINLAMTAEKPPLADVDSTVDDQNTATAFSISLNKFYLADDANFHFSDQSVQPSFERNLTISSLVLGPINTLQPDIVSKYLLKGKSDQYSHFDISGTMTPFANVPSYQLQGAIKEVSLPDVSPYIKNALKHEFQSGQLDLTLDVAVQGTKIAGNADVLLRGVELTAADDHRVNTLNDQTSVPFNIALGMLKDSDGKIDLTIPISGETNSPSFSLAGFASLLIKQATMSATKEYLITTFVPFASVVKVAMIAGEYALRVRMNDLEFPATVVTLQPEHQIFLKQFSALMKEKADLVVKLCPVATSADLGKSNGITEPNEIKMLNDISTTRINAFKTHMVDVEKIASSRILLCVPQYDENKAAKSRITFII